VLKPLQTIRLPGPSVAVLAVRKQKQEGLTNEWSSKKNLRKNTEIAKNSALSGNRTQDICLEGRYFTTKLIMLM
jgi:predicted DNA-binding antitoxin AbrB/MazE fold protein